MKAAPVSRECQVADQTTVNGRASFASLRTLVPAFGGLVRRLEADFRARCESEPDTQDSSEYARVRVPVGATACGTRIVVCVSKFGSLAEVCADNRGAFFGTEDARQEGALDPADLATVEQALAELGYVSVPEELLGSDYEGPSVLEDFAVRPTWWTRFFGTVW